MEWQFILCSALGRFSGFIGDFAAIINIFLYYQPQILGVWVGVHFQPNILTGAPLSQKFDEYWVKIQPWGQGFAGHEGALF
jgi:hypothetical protein